MGSDEKVEALIAINMRVIRGTPRVIRVRRAEVLLTVIEAFNLIEDLMVDRGEILVRKGVEARANALGWWGRVHRCTPYAPPQLPRPVGGSTSPRVFGVSQKPPMLVTP